MFEADSRSGHSCKAVRVYEIDLTASEHFRVIGAARNYNQRSHGQNFDKESRTPHLGTAEIKNLNSKIENVLGPPGFEPGTKGL